MMYPLKKLSFRMYVRESTSFLQPSISLVQKWNLFLRWLERID